MLNDSLKLIIQQSYRQFLNKRQLKPRYGQKLMIAEIANTLGGIKLDKEGLRQSNGHVCVIEAGTGTGKTVAYLLAALPIARERGKRLVISTATIALQEQIVNKDLPDLMKDSGLSFSFAIAKGRRRYLCLSKLDKLLADYKEGSDPGRALFEDELPQVDEKAVKIYDSMVDALAANRWDGDGDNWPEPLSPEVWSSVTTDHRQCTGRRCSHISSCHFFKAREQISRADCIVTNHDLVLADLALGGGAILPPPAETFYIFDEGHHLPEKALNHFACHSRLQITRSWLEQCQKSLGPMLGHISGAGKVDKYAEELPAALLSAKQHLDEASPVIEGLMQSVAEEPQSNRAGRQRLITREQSLRYRFEQGAVPDELQLLSEALHLAFQQLTDLLTKMIGEMEQTLEDSHSAVPKVDLENWYPVVGLWLAKAEVNQALWGSYSRQDPEGQPPTARWLTQVDYGGTQDIEVCSSPILAARTLSHHLWSRCGGSVVTSATLTALGRFDRFQMRAGIPSDSRYQCVPSPFNFPEAATLRIPAASCDASDAKAHTASVTQLLPEILKADEASLVLFSSRRQMQDVYDGLPSHWQRRILLQGERSKQEILKQHRRQVDAGGGSILFGLASFAEGLDLPGVYCRHVVVAKIPFSVPDDPIESALAEWIQARGGNPFMEITVPDASIKLVQACGRLVRTEKDTGVISILDRRLLTRRYGKMILDSLPPFRREFD